jgi:NADPH:quinone reductase-like Zn-dependent oxidoreductase
MRAVMLEQFGEPADVLRVREVPVPEPQAGQVRVRMLASPVNPSDLMTVRGVYGVHPPLPASAGFEGVGIVQASGGGWLGRLFQGRRVVVLNRGGGNWAEQVVVPAKQVIPVARDLPVEQAAMFFVNPAAAYVMTRVLLRVPPGAWVLQTAAGSAVGRMVIRLGTRFGFRTLNVVRREEQIDELRALGGTDVVCFDPARHEQRMLAERVRSIAGNEGVPFVLDPVGGATASALVPCLATRGRMVIYGTLSDDPLAVSPRELMGRQSSIEGFWLARWVQGRGLWARLRFVRNLTQLIREGVLVSEVEREFSLEQIADAVRAAEQPGRHGKVLLRINAQ